MLSILQQLLQRLYGIQVEQSVTDYVVTDPGLVRRLRGQTGQAPETLLLRQQGDTLELSLYLDAGLLSRLSAADPLHRLRRTDIEGFCILLEGVSHFLYLVWHGVRARGLTQLELELQAEVDKYALLGYLLKAQHQGTLPAWLPRQLFERVRYRADLTGAQRDRYQAANHYARRYCRRLQRRFQWAWNGRSLLQELRRFYRLDQARKLRHIEHCG